MAVPAGMLGPVAVGEMASMNRLGGFVAAVTLALAVGCGAPAASPAGTPPTTAGFPVTLSSGAASVTVPARPTRIVSLSPTATESLFAIGAGDQVVAVDKNSDRPTAAPHTDLDAYQLNAEAVAGYHPDLVVTSGMTPAQVAQLRALRLPVLDTPAPGTLEQAYTQILDLGRATGRDGQADALVGQLRRQVTEIVASTPRPPAGTTYYYELDQSGYSVTSSTFVGQLLGLLGLTSIADQAPAAGGYPQLTSEYVVKADPGYVLLADTRCCGQSAATVAARPGWSTLSAVRNGRIVSFDDDDASRWGPHVVDLLQTMATALKEHPVR